MDSNKATKPTFLIVFTSLVIDLMSFTLILPLMPSILDYYSKNDSSGLYSWFESKVQFSQQLLGSPQQFNKVLFGGLIGSWFSLLQYISQPIVGSFSDVYGRKPLLLICLSGICVSYLFWSLSAQMFTIFLISRSIGGLSKGNISLSTAIVTDVSDETTRGKGMALIGISFSVGFIVGPVLGAWFAVLSRSADEHHFFQLWPALLASSLSIANVVFVWRYFKESLPSEQRRSLGSGVMQAFDYINPLSLFSFRPVVNARDIDLIVLKRGSRLYFLFLYLYSGLEFTLTFLTNSRFNFTSADQGKLFLLVGLVMTLVQGGYVRRIKPRQQSLVIVTALVSIIPAFLIIGFAATQTQLYAGLVLYAYSSAAFVPCLTTVISSFGPSDQKGVILGIFRSIGALARALGPISASLIFWRFGSTVCYSLGALLLIFPLIMALNLKKLIDKHIRKD